MLNSGVSEITQANNLDGSLYLPVVAKKDGGIYECLAVVASVVTVTSALVVVEGTFMKYMI